MLKIADILAFKEALNFVQGNLSRCIFFEKNVKKVKQTELCDALSCYEFSVSAFFSR